MPQPTPELLVAIAAALLLAGFVKGLLGIGLPAIAIGLLATRIPPAQALAIVIVPAFLTNVWQTFSGSYLLGILRRLWPLMVGVCLGVVGGAGLLTGPYARYAPILLGALLASYAVLGLGNVRFHVAQTHEKWIGGVVGLVTGFVSASTGVQVVPSMPFMQALGLEKDELIQALGTFFTVVYVALSYNLTSAGLLTHATVLPGAVALAGAFAGLVVGQLVRAQLDAEAFRKWFLVGVLLLGLYLVASTILRLA